MLMTPLRIIFLGKNKNTVVQYPPLDHGEEVTAEMGKEVRTSGRAR